MKRVALALVVGAALPPGVASSDEVSAGVYVRTDSDGTDVVSPRVRGRASVIDDSTTVDLGYAADIWTSASVDIRTAATRAVTEQRDEITAGARRELEDLAVSGGYRFSVENDYVSHGGGVNVERRLADGAATVEGGVNAAVDIVGRSGDDMFERPITSLGARIAYTQVVDPETIAQGSYELQRREGYQASPYRFIGVGGDGLCRGTAVWCIPETHPSVRFRHSLVARVRRSFGDDLSGGAEYRLYLDDWGIVSHTAIGQLGLRPDEDSMLVARYRFYTQKAAAFYRSSYQMPRGQLNLVTGDRELSPMATHRILLGYERAVDLTDAGPTTKFSIGVAAGVLSYDDFPGLDQVRTFDVTVGAAVEL